MKKQGKYLNANFIITVFNNDPKLKCNNGKHGFRILSKEELAGKEKEIRAKLDKLKDIIINKKASHNKDTEYTYKYGFILEQIILLAIKSQGSKSIKNYFYTDSKCIGCGLCEKVCLSKKIVITEGRPYWQEDTLCHMCYACLNFCPAESIQINSKWYMKSYTNTQGRYPHPYASAKEIEAQKNYYP